MFNGNDLPPSAFPDTELGDFQEFVEGSRSFSVATSADNRMELIWACSGLASEAGEVLGEVEKMLRKDRSQEDIETAIVDELGDVLWYCAAIANATGRTIDEVIEANIDKLNRRREAGRKE
jgi:NTP pyrophosphatase (non-canonical NTP hydrolase)